jgi:hypothetical protein
MTDDLGLAAGDKPNVIGPTCRGSAAFATPASELITESTWLARQASPVGQAATLSELVPTLGGRLPRAHSAAHENASANGGLRSCRRSGLTSAIRASPAAELQTSRHRNLA